MGVDAGLPDFRGTEGFWRAYPPMAKLQLKLEDMSTPHWFDDDPCFAWGFFGHRYDLYTTKIPHEGYHILKQFVDSKNNEDCYWCFTSNVDGHFMKVFPENRVSECHGSLRHLQCTNHEECTPEIWKVTDHTQGTTFPFPVDLETFRASEPLPQCKNCHRLARPNILMFSDYEFAWDRTEDQDTRERK
jgi:NAD-dependent SIR2 family protein deacetylase